MGRGWRGRNPALGRSLVNAANWLTHLEYEWESPVWKHWIQFFSAQNRFVRYDERGCGMSDWQVGTLSLDQWTADFESIIDAARPAGPVTLLGISQGAAACIRFAIQHPERVARLILYGARYFAFASSSHVPKHEDTSALDPNWTPGMLKLDPSAT